MCYLIFVSQGFKEVSTRAHIGVKKMGELDIKPFLVAAKRKCSIKEVDVKSAELCTLWQDYLRDPSWHPFKILTGKEGNCKVFFSFSIFYTQIIFWRTHTCFSINSISPSLIPL